MEMLENGQYNCKFRALNKTLEDSVSVSSESFADQLAYKLAGVDRDGTIIPSLAEEFMEVDHFLSEPKLDNIVEDNVLGLELGNQEKCLKIGDFSCPDDLCQLNTGTMSSDAKQEAEKEPKFEFLDGMLQGVDEEGNLHVTNDLSNDCADYLLDAGFAEKHSHLDYGHCEGDNLRNLCSEGFSPGLSEREMSPAGMRSLSTTIVPLPESNFGQSTFLLDNMSIRELHEAFRSTFGRETSVKDKQWLKRRILFGLQNLIEVENGSSLLVSGLSSHQNEADLIMSSGNDSSGSSIHQNFTNTHGDRTPLLGRGMGTNGHATSDVMVSVSGAEKIGFGRPSLEERESALLNRKRLRRPTRRYIEESDVTSRTCNGKLETSTANMTHNCSRARSHNRYHQKEFETSTLVSRQLSVGGSGLQVSSGCRVRRGRPRKNSTSLMGHDYKEEHRMLSVQSKKYCGLGSSHSESHDDMSDDCATPVRTGKSGIRRKHHRLWTLAEVMKLIEGVSQHGVGRWTDIKRLLFSSSGHRTSVDLKDKWRNLLRASCVQMQNKKEVERRRKHASLPIPPTVLRRVRELAVIYPYPRERKPRPPPAAVATTPVTGTGSDTSMSRSGRILHRRNFA
ncbi:hypothetical protein AAC387_Pa11g0065 [Persea americana]